MLFNSYEFLALFLPLSFFGYILLSRYVSALTRFWLAALSLIFYASWDPTYLPLLLGSIAINFTFGYILSQQPHRFHQTVRRSILVCSIVINLFVLALFKYANFLLQTIAALTNYEIPDVHVVLPPGISFYTFTQIAYLVDCFRDKVREPHALHYTLFVSFFPHLIAGPILHHSEMMPQFKDRLGHHVDWHLFSIGITTFIIGLFKKTVIADYLAGYVSPIFDGAISNPITFTSAWLACIGYTLQLYYDFSGYSDMAIGLACLFGIRFPQNFNSPLKACSIIEFWRRWHMTLSRFLREYLYIPLGGNKRGEVNRYLNLLITMLLGGLWHGAGWTFVVWGALHGAYLCLNHAWRYGVRRLGVEMKGGSYVTRGISTITTFLAVAIAFVVFRASSLVAARNVLSGLAGMTEGPDLETTISNPMGLFPFALLVLLVITFIMPNSQELMRYTSVLEKAPASISPAWPRWQPNLIWAVVCVFLGVSSVVCVSRTSAFLYFQF